MLQLRKQCISKLMPHMAGEVHCRGLILYSIYCWCPLSYRNGCLLYLALVITWRPQGGHLFISLTAKINNHINVIILNSYAV